MLPYFDKRLSITFLLSFFYLFNNGIFHGNASSLSFGNVFIRSFLYTHSVSAKLYHFYCNHIQSNINWSIDAKLRSIHELRMNEIMLRAQCTSVSISYNEWKWIQFFIIVSIRNWNWLKRENCTQFNVNVFIKSY